MVHISDQDFFRSIRPAVEGLGDALKAARRKDYEAAWAMLQAYAATRDEPKPSGEYSEALRDVPAQSAEGRRHVAEADKVAAHEITGWHSTTIKFGKEIDFNADFGQFGIYGFHFMAWFAPLARAFALTGDPKHAQAFDDIFSQWYEQRDKVEFKIAELDPIWYELGMMRTLTLMRMYYVFRSCPQLRVATVTKLWKTFLGHARWLAQRESEGYRIGNWQQSGCISLLSLGRFCPEFKDSGRWVELARQMLMEHVERGFYKDGGYSERTFGYGRAGLWTLGTVRDLFPDDGAVRRKVKTTLARALRHYLLTSTPLATTPATGDGGYAPLQGILEGGARDTGNGELLWPIRGGLTRIERARLPKPVKPKVTSMDLRPSGFAVMRTGWARDNLYMLINYSPDCPTSHTHSSALDFEMFGYGTGLALEVSRFDSYDNPLDYYFRCARAHNQLVVNDEDLEREKLEVDRLKWHSDDNVDFFAGRHHGYSRSHGVLVARKIVFVKPHFWLVSDVARESGHRQFYTWYLHMPMKQKIGKDKSVICGNGPGLQIIPARPEEVRHVREGVDYEEQDLRAPIPFPNRYWIGFQKFDYLRCFATYAVLLAPFRERPRELALKPLEVTGRKGAAERTEAEGFEVDCAGQEFIITLSHARAARRRYGPVEDDSSMAVFSKDGKAWRKLSSLK